jgi:ADP-L-glycero-D-manno-heptose 6-epimerase
MIVITGGAGFIGSKILRAMNAAGREDILVVDDLTDGSKYKNLLGCKFHDYQHHQDFLTQLANNVPFADSITAIVHQGACSSDTETDGRYMMKNNFSYSKVLLHYCADKKIPFIYASSSDVYGAADKFTESESDLRPLNVCAFSKFAFDNYVQRILPDIGSQVVGMRYFDVYGPGEETKGDSASVIARSIESLNAEAKIELYEGSGGYGDGEQRRDFVHVDDIASANLWFLDNDNVSGIYNIGTGVSHSFNDLANTLIDLRGSGKVKYIPLPEGDSSFQPFSEADISALREAGYDKDFISMQDGVASYYKYITTE